MVNKLHRNGAIPQTVIPKKGGCPSLCSNKGNQHPPFLGVRHTISADDEDVLLEYLAEILVDIFLNSEAFHGTQTSSNILSSIDKRTS